MLPDRTAQMDKAIRRIPGLVDFVQQALIRVQHEASDYHRPSLAEGVSLLWLNCLCHDPQTPRTRVQHGVGCMGFTLAIHELWSAPTSWGSFWQVPVVNTGYYGTPINSVRMQLGGEVAALQELHDEFAELDRNDALVATLVGS